MVNLLVWVQACIEIRLSSCICPKHIPVMPLCCTETMNYHKWTQKSWVCFQHFKGKLLTFHSRPFIDSHSAWFWHFDHIFHRKRIKLDVFFVGLDIVNLCEKRDLFSLQLCQFIADSIQSHKSVLISLN